MQSYAVEVGIAMLTCAISGGAAAVVAADAAGTVKLVHAPNEPMVVTSMRFEDKQRGARDVLLEVRNRSEKEIRYVGYVLGWPDCPRQRMKPGSPIISYGSVGPRRSIHRAVEEKPIEPGVVAVLRIPGKMLEGMERWKKKYGCAETVLPELVLMNVAFTDGTGWEGFADGPNHDQWNGRPWTPPPVQPEKGRQPKK